VTTSSAARLGAYVLPGPAMDPQAVLGQAVEAERIGLGSVWLSELQGPLKDAGAILGFLGHATQRVTLGTSITHFGTRHPMVLASWGLTMQALTGGRFAMGFGRSTNDRWRDWGVPVPTLASMEDHASVLRRLWAHEAVTSDGPAGMFPHLSFQADHHGDWPDVTPPPLLLAAIGPPTLELAGRAFDGVFLHPFLTPEAVGRSRDVVRSAARDAGRDPEGVRIIHEVVCAPDMSQADTDMAVRGRIGAYFAHPTFADPIVAVNGWDIDVVHRYRAAAAEAHAENVRARSPLHGRQVLIEPSRLLPDSWLRETAGIGAPAEVAGVLRDFLAAGADEIVVHGATPDRLESTVAALG
jgi:5,10-methylenetetrahydromethanopterin reductase